MVRPDEDDVCSLLPSWWHRFGEAFFEIKVFSATVVLLLLRVSDYFGGVSFFLFLPFYVVVCILNV
jgi:hypothetical protein